MSTPPMPRCSVHPEKPVTCGICRSEVLADPARRAEFDGRVQGALCDIGFPPRYVTARVDHPEVAAWVEQWHAQPAEARSLLLLGNVGTGKTWQAYGALRAAVTGSRPSAWKATTAADMFADLRPRHGHDTEAALHALRNVPLLLIDDLGAAKTSEWVEEITYRVIGGRYDAMLPTIYTSNVSVSGLKAAVGDRIASRLAETCTRVVMTGPDRRRVTS